MAQQYVYTVDGLRELLAATDRADSATKRMVRNEIREVARPVLNTARQRLAPYDARSAARLGISVRRVGTVSVEQRLRRTTGHRPDFGALQMREALIPALASHEDEIVDRFDDALGRIATHWGAGG